MMKPVNDSYPVFEANQILSNLHLNQLFDYLGEQERLTRANLVGIGIVCGLGLKLDAGGATLRLGRGVGITSAGYLAVEADEVALVAYRPYLLPQEPDYPPLRDLGAALHPQYPLWEMFADDEPDTTPFGTPPGFLDDKAALLFVELRQEGLRNCSPNNCNDRGAQVTVTLRRLLIRSADLARVIAAGAALGDGLSVAALEAALSERLNLPDLRLLRFDVPNTGPATSEQVLAAFQAVFRRDGLATKTGKALSAAYTAFRPLLHDDYPNDPFADFVKRFGFLDTAAQTTGQVLFLQYYHDLFDDLILAYDEFRWKGVELLCACCPSERLFPRHLMLGLARPASVDNPALYRHGFVPACAGDELKAEVQLLFRRLAGMVQAFTDQPMLPASKIKSEALLDPQLRIIPSDVGACRLADMALPYYYRLDLDDTKPLYQYWSAQRTRRGRANQNLGYRSDEYEPAAPKFVLEALKYTLAPYDFLRIEGHLGKAVAPVLRALLELKRRYRLPIDVIALRTGAFDESIPLGSAVRVQDLETLYDTLREELLCQLGEGVRYLYDVPAGVKLAGGRPKLALLVSHAPGFVYGADSVGAWFENNLALFQARPYIDPDQNKIDANAVLQVYCVLFANTSPQLQSQFFAHAVSVYYLSKLSEALPASLDALAYADFENKYQDLVALTRFLRSDASRDIGADLQQFFPVEALIDQFDQVLYGCHLDPMKALHDEFLRRVRDAKSRLFLAPFLQTNPGIAHKAGVPLGGTFILVYHGGPAPLPVNPNTIARDALVDALARLGKHPELSFNPDLRLLRDALAGALDGAGTGTLGEPGVPRPPFADPAGIGAVRPPFRDPTDVITGAVRPPFRDPADVIIGAAVERLEAGVVIADFFVPYLYSCDCPALQYVLPLPPLGLQVTLGCTNSDGNAEATLVPEGGMLPISYQLDGLPFAPLVGALLLVSGPHTVSIRDSAGSASLPQALTVPATLRTEQPEFSDDQESMSYRVSFLVSGGTLPYAADSGSIDFNRYTSVAIASGEPLRVVLTDAAGCQTGAEFTHTVPPLCVLPCDGFARRCGYRFWLPEPDRDRPFEANGVASEVPVFRIEIAPGKMIDLHNEVAKILRADANALNNSFDKVAGEWVAQINRLLAKAAGNEDTFVLAYERKDGAAPTLWIERFECLDFEFRVQTFFTRNGIKVRHDLVHTPNGSSYQLPDAAVDVPPFDCSRIAKCDPARPVEQMCKEVDLQLKIMVLGFGDRIEVNVVISGSDAPVAFLWEVSDCTPAVAGGEKVTFAIQTQAPVLKQIALSAFTKNGCMVTARTQINPF
jgi:hypothetical protein